MTLRFETSSTDPKVDYEVTVTRRRPRMPWVDSQSQPPQPPGAAPTMESVAANTAASWRGADDGIRRRHQASSPSPSP